MPDNTGPTVLPPHGVGPTAPNFPSLPPSPPHSPVNNYPPATLPDWVAPTQNNNPSAFDINGLGTTLNERILTLSPWGSYVPIIFGEDYIGPIITLIHSVHPYIYFRLVWCVGEIESIENVKLQGGATPPFADMTHYTGTSGQGVDPWLASAISGYSDTLTDVGIDGLNLAYSVIRINQASYDSFPRFVAKIKGLKVNSPVPVIESVDRDAADGNDDTVVLAGNTVTATDVSNNGAVTPFVRYYVDELIDGDSYTFEIEVTEYSNRGTGTAGVYWAGNQLLDEDDNHVIINGVGTYIGSASEPTYDGSHNALRIDVTGDAGVVLAFEPKMYNTDGNSVKKYHDTAGLALNHMMTNEQIGLGLSVNYPSLVDLVHRNNEVLETTGFSEIRSSIGLSLIKKRPIRQAIEVMRGYARCNITNVNGEVKYLTHAPKEASFTITNSDIKPGTWDPNIKDIRDIPNIVRVYYTDIFHAEPRDNFVEVMTTEVESGDEKKREAIYRMPGYRSRTAALRFGNDIINQRLRTFGVKFRTHQSVYDHHEGDTFNLVVDQFEGVSQKMKMIYKKKINLTEYEIYAEKESDSIYSNEIEDFDPGDDILLQADPFTVIDATVLDIEVETPDFQTGIYFSRLRVGWTATEYVYRHTYLCELYEHATDALVSSTQLPQGLTEAVFNNIQENIEYRIELKVIGIGGNQSTGLVDTVTPAGKDFPPTDVPGFNVSHFIGSTTCTWNPAADNNEVWYYEIQFGPSAFEWNDTNARLLISRIDAYEFISQGVPSGTWDFLIKAVDNAGNESTNATRVSDVVIVDNPEYEIVKSGAITIDESDSVGMTPFLSDRVVVTLGLDSSINNIKDYTPDTGQSWGDTFTNTMDTYQFAPFLVYGSGVAESTLYTDSINIGQEIDGFYELSNTVSGTEISTYFNVTGGDMIEVLSGDPPLISIQLSDDNSIWTDHVGLSTFGTASYMRLKITSQNQTDRWIYRAGSYLYKIKGKIKTEYENFTWNAVSNNTFDFERVTTDLQFASISIATAGDYRVTFSPVLASPTRTQGLAIDVYDSAGSVVSTDIDLKIIVRYV